MGRQIRARRRWGWKVKAECKQCGRLWECDCPQSPQPARESYADAKKEFERVHFDYYEFEAFKCVEKLHPREALSLATELQRLCQLRANEAALDK